MKERTGLPALILVLVGLALLWRALVPSAPTPPIAPAPSPSTPRPTTSAAPWMPRPAIVELDVAWDRLPGGPLDASLFVLSGHALIALNLDSGSIRAMDLGASSDAPIPLLAQGGWLVYRSHGQTTLVRPDLVTPGGRGWPSLWFVPSGRMDRVWDVFAPGGGWTGLPASVTETLLGPERRGPHIDASVLPSHRVPLAGWGDRLVLGTDEGIEVWDPLGASTTVLPSGAGLVAAAGGRLAWCEPGCARLHLVDAVTLQDRVVSSPAGTSFDRGAVFAPGGGSLAVSIGPDPPDDRRSTVAIVDGATGAIRAAGSMPDGRVTNLAWAPSGDWVFASVEHQELFAVRASDGLVHPILWRLGSIDALASM